MKNGSARVGKRRYGISLKPLSGRPDLTPFVDVVFLLLIFFLLGSSFIQLFGIEVSLPRVASGRVQGAQDVITISYSSENGALFYFDDRPVAFDALPQELAAIKARDASASLIVRADDRVPTGITMQVISLASQASLPSVIAVLPPEIKSETRFDEL